MPPTGRGRLMTCRRRATPSLVTVRYFGFALNLIEGAYAVARRPRSGRFRLVTLPLAPASGKHVASVNTSRSAVAADNSAPRSPRPPALDLANVVVFGGIVLLQERQVDVRFVRASAGPAIACRTRLCRSVFGVGFFSVAAKRAPVFAFVPPRRAPPASAPRTADHTSWTRRAAASVSKTPSDRGESARSVSSVRPHPKPDRRAYCLYCRSKLEASSSSRSPASASRRRRSTGASPRPARRRCSRRASWRRASARA